MNYRVRKAFTMCIILAAFVIVFSRFLKGTESLAQGEIQADRQKYYTNYVVAQGDSLWSIAGVYMTAEYGSVRDYIDEVIEANGLGGEGTIYEGQLLVLPYYSSGDESTDHSHEQIAKAAD